jgi:hypothetical protein
MTGQRLQQTREPHGVAGWGSRCSTGEVLFGSAVANVADLDAWLLGIVSQKLWSHTSPQLTAFDSRVHGNVNEANVKSTVWQH